MNKLIRALIISLLTGASIILALLGIWASIEIVGYIKELVGFELTFILVMGIIGTIVAFVIAWSESHDK